MINLSDNEVASFAVGLFIGALIFGISGLFYGAKIQRQAWKETAIERGYAKMVMVDSLSGESEFFWNNDSLILEKK